MNSQSFERPTAFPNLSRFGFLAGLGGAGLLAGCGGGAGTIAAPIALDFHKMSLQELLRRAGGLWVTENGVTHYADGTTGPARGGTKPQGDCLMSPLSNKRSVKDLGCYDPSVPDDMALTATFSDPGNPLNMPPAVGGGVSAQGNPLQWIGGVTVVANSWLGQGSLGYGNIQMQAATALGPGPFYGVRLNYRKCQDKLQAAAASAYAMAQYVMANAWKYSAAIGNAARQVVSGWQGASTVLGIAAGLEFLGACVAALGGGELLALLLIAGLTVWALYLAFDCLANS